MVVYSYYYGASAGQGIGIRAQSKQLESLPISSDLKDLSSLHALESSDHEGEMLSYMLHRDGYRILGLSYNESPKSSGYNRSAPCGLQYIVPEDQMESADQEMGKIINFVNFQKPSSASPAPLNAIPLNESGYYYHNSADVLAALVDGLLKVSLSTQKEVLLVALPKSKNSEYATARYAIAEAMNYLPAPLRRNIRFFTGLPVEEGGTDCLAGFDNALKYNANVIFCPGEYFERLKSYRSVTGLDMDRPNTQTGAYAAFVARSSNPSGAVSQVCDNLSGKVSYDSINKAAQKVQQGGAVTLETVRSALAQSENKCAELQRLVNMQDKDITDLQRERDALKDRLNYSGNSRQTSSWASTSSGKKKGFPIWAAILIVLVLMAAAWFGASYLYTGSLLPAVYKQGNEADAGEPAKDQTATPPASDAQNADNGGEKALPQDDQGTQGGGEDTLPADGQGTPPDGGQDTQGGGEDTPLIVDEGTVPSEDQPAPTGGDGQAIPPDDGNAAEPDTAAADSANIVKYLYSYGKINGTRVALRSSSYVDESDNNLIQRLDRGSFIWMIHTELNEQGEEWTRVYYNNQVGYVMTKFLEAIPQRQSDQRKVNYPIPAEYDDPALTGGTGESL